MREIERYIKRKQIKRIILIFACMLVLFIFVMLAFGQLNNRYFRGTTINEIDCSFLTTEEAMEKFEEEIFGSQSVNLIVLKIEDGDYSEKEYKVSYDFLEVNLNLQVFEEILENQKVSKEKNFTVQYDLNEEILKDYLLSVPELSDGYKIDPQNAYLKMGENGLIEIVDEVYGLQFDFDKVYEYALMSMKNGETEINFTELIETSPEILSSNESLIQNRDEINSILETKITFVLSDESEVVLDKTTLSEWVNAGEDGYFYFDKSKIEEFVSELADTVNEKNSTETFYATDIGEITISVKESLRVNLDQQAEIVEIKKYLGTGGSYIVKPIYDGEFVTNTDTYVELDITRQKVWLYVDGECILETDCVTGNVSKGYSTPTGIYYLTYKTQNATLRGTNSDGSKYASFVNYWMPFNGGIGFHDATWRSSFGGEIYKTNGSHGCVNLPKASAETLYEYITSDMPIFVYESP